MSRQKFKHEDNVIFDKEGLQELLTHIKNYPVIGINDVGEEDWEYVSESQPSIEVKFGGLENNSCYVKTKDSTPVENKKYYYLENNEYKELTDASFSENVQYYEKVAGTKYVKVGSNIIFKDSNGNAV